jgi:putative sterol carrier protein
MTENSPAHYFEQVAPQQLTAALQDGGPQDLITTYEITGEGGGTYGLRISGTTVEFVPGGIADSDLRTTMSIDNWHSGGAESVAVLAEQLRNSKADVIKGLKGTVRLDLTRSDGSAWESTAVFGGEEEPSVTLQMTSDDYADMMSGKLNGQMAFMTGKLKFDGSLPLLMQVGALSS